VLARDEVLTKLLPRLFDDSVTYDERELDSELNNLRHLLVKRIVIRKVEEELQKVDDAHITCNCVVDLFIEACVFAGLFSI